MLAAITLCPGSVTEVSGKDNHQTAPGQISAPQRLVFNRPDSLEILQSFCNKIQGTPKDDQDFYYIGHYHWMMGDYDKCRSVCNEAIKQHPQWISPYLVMAEVSHSTYDDAAGLDYCRKALSLNPCCLDTLLDYAKLLRQERQFEKALECSNTALKIIESHPGEFAPGARAIAKTKGLIERSRCLILLNRRKEAIACMDEIRRLTPGMTIVHTELIDTLIDDKQPGRAIAVASQALKLRSSDFDYYLQRARAYKLNNQPQKAVEDLTTFINIASVKATYKPSTVEAREMRAALCEQIGNKKLAELDRSYLKGLINSTYANAPFRSATGRKAGAK